MIHHIKNAQTLTLRGDYLKIGRNNTTVALLLDFLETNRQLDPDRDEFTVNDLFCGLMGMAPRQKIINAMGLLTRISLVLGMKFKETYYIKLNENLINEEIGAINQVAA